MIRVRRHASGEVCPAARGRMPVADRNTGYSPMVITLRERRHVRLAGASWLTALLGFSGYERCWALYDPCGAEARLSVAEWNRTLRSAGEVREAQLWAAQFIEASDLARQEKAAAGSGWLQVPPAPVRVTEWRVVLFGGRSFFAPLFNVTPVFLLPVRDVLPATGADCGCGDDGGERG
jgi:hypothetical protein